jgi:two-component system, NarL family, invasion response regulator UvrY
MAVRVVTVDDQAVFQRAAEVVIDASPGFELAGQAASGDEGLAIVEQLRPDLVLLDVRMPGMDGVETARRLAECRPEVVVVLITVQEPPVAPGASTCGAVRLVSKRQFCPALLREIWSDHGARVDDEAMARGSRVKRPEPSPSPAEAGRSDGS